MEKAAIETASYLQLAARACSEREQGLSQVNLTYFKDKLAGSEKFLWEKHRHLSTGQPKSGNYLLNITAQQQLVLNKAMATSGASIQDLTLAALAVYYYKTSSLPHLAFGITLHKRKTGAQKQAVGMFSGVVPLAVHLNDSLTTDQLLKDIAAGRIAVRTHQNVLMVDLAGQISTGQRQSPLLDVVVNFAPYNYPTDFGDLQLSSLEMLRSEYQQFPLEICWRAFGPQQPLQLGIHYQYQYFSKEEIALFVHRLFYLIEQFATGTAQNIKSFHIVPVEEQQILNNFSLHHKKAGALWQFEAQVQQNPHHVAAICGGSQLTYEALNQKANRLARYLQIKGVLPNTLVPVCIDRCTDLLVCILAVLKAGGAYLPLDPQYPHERLMFMLEDTSASLVLSNTFSKEALEGNGIAAIINIDTLNDTLNTFSADNLPVAISATDLAYIMYTSGSTGKPKGVMIEHGNIEALIQWAEHQYSTTSFDLVYFSTSICFDLSVFEIFYPLSIGKTIRIVNNGLDIMNYLASDKNTLINTVPLVMETMLKEQADLSNVKIINMCGEPVPVHVKDGLPTDRAQVFNLYGPTEATVYSTVFRLTRNEAVLIGKPLINSTIFLLDKNNRPVPLGETGEICIGGAGVARGYFNRPELTIENFIQDPFMAKPHARLYKTGDLGRWSFDGNLEYIGRVDNQVKVNGYRIDLGEIENILLESKLLSQAAVKVFTSEAGGKYLVGYVVPLQGEKFKLSDLKLHLAKLLPQFMLPSQWMILQQMPLTSNGKINRKTLPVYSPGLPSIVKFTPPVGELETALHSIWKEVLPYDLIGTTHSFFTVGGNSIMAVQIAARVRQLGYTIQPRDIFYYPTIQQLADFLASQKCNSNEPVLATPNPKVSNNRAGSFKYLIAAQKGKTNRTPLYIICGGGGNFFTFLNFIEQLHPDQPVYIMEYPADVESVAILPGNIKTLATLYIQEMLLNNPEGQFVLSGHCIGGVIAFEMAQQLEAAGKTVDKLLIFDSILRTQNEVHPMMVSHQTWPKGKFMGKAFALYQRLCFQLFLFRKHPRFALTYKIQAATKWLKSNLSDSKYDEAFKETKVYDDLKDKFSAAYKKYRLTPFHKQFFVFYAKDQFYFFDKKNNITYKRYEISTEIKERWLQYGRHVQLFDIEGGHNTMFDRAFGGKDLAQKVQQLIGSGTYTT